MSRTLNGDELEQITKAMRDDKHIIENLSSDDSDYFFERHRRKNREWVNPSETPDGDGTPKS